MTFQEIYIQFNKTVYNLSLNYLQNKEDAEEVTQDTFVAIHTSLHTFKENSQLSTWIYRITINQCLDFIKAKKRKKRFALFTELFKDNNEEINHGFPSFDHPGVLLEQKEIISRIFSCINQLPTLQKTALILSKLENKSQKEIAEIMNSTPKAVESLIQRAKKNLSQKLNQAKEI